MSNYGDIAIPITVGVGAWFAAMPEIAEIQRRDSADCADVRAIESLVTVLTLGTGVAGTLVTHSRGPLIASVLTLAALFVVYEYSIRMESQ